MTTYTILNMYIFLGAPVFAYLFIRALRKSYDVDVGMLIGVGIISILPFAREAVLCMCYERDLKNLIVFKKYE